MGRSQKLLHFSTPPLEPLTVLA
jgi:hypothetical protein